MIKSILLYVFQVIFELYVDTDSLLAYMWILIHYKHTCGY